MILPPLLRPGDTVGVIAPSGPVDRERLLDGISYLQRRGYGVQEGASLYARTRYLAGSDADRAADLNQMLGDREVRAIFTARGGYGSARLLDLVDYDLVREDPKIFVGFSDTTALQLGLYARTGLVSYSGVVLCKDVNSAGMVGPTEERLWDALAKGRFSPLEGLQTLRAGRAGGPLLGGCLSLVVSLAGDAVSAGPGGRRALPGRCQRAPLQAGPHVAPAPHGGHIRSRRGGCFRAVRGMRS